MISRYYGQRVPLRYTRTVDPTLDPITLVEAKLQARITDDRSDTIISSYIKAATDAAEQALGRGLLTQSWRLDLDYWWDVVHLPMAAPLQSVTSVQYYDGDGILQTLAATSYDVDVVARPGRLVRASATAWPGLAGDKLVGKVQITYVVGWTAADLIPDRIKQGIRSYVTYLDADRDGLSDVSGAAWKAADACWSDKVYVVESCA